jgi:HAD superfamily hydrolase (TIGR01450 family)
MNGELKNKKLFLLDMDGTIYIDDVLFEHSLKFLNAIKAKGGEFVFLTNNSSKGVNDYIVRLSRLGIKVNKSNFLTSSQATALYLKENYGDKKIYVLGTKSLKKEFEDNNIWITDKYEDDINCLVVGYDTELTYSKLVDACRLLITKDIDFIATNPDLICPVSFGYVPDCGSICDMLKVATKRKAKYIGKPNPTMVELAVKNSRFAKGETIVIGDRLYTDIACGINAKVSTALVLSGETKKEDLSKSKYKPDYIFHDIGEIYNYYTT